MSNALWVGNPDESRGFEIWKDGLNTYIEVYSDDNRVELTWVQAQRLLWWLKERLGE